MQHLSIPTCYFPSTTIFVDDNRDFLLNFVLQLDEWLAYRIYDSPFDALECIQKKYRELDLLVERCYSNHKEITKSEPAGKNASPPAILSELHNARRFADISVVVVDYAMPGMNGLEFCRQISNTNIKKILLTGKADEGLAMAALNEGLIHRYIHKSDPDVAELITRSISELQLQFFQDISADLVRLLSLHSPACLSDKTFVEFFRKFCHEEGVVEYYLVDNSGSFLLLDVDANISFLIVKTEAQVRSFYELAREHDVDNQVLERLMRGEKIPAINYSENSSIKWHDISASLVTATPLIANEKYFYSHVQGLNLFNVRHEGLFSYHSYLQEIDAEELLLVG